MRLGIKAVLLVIGLLCFGLISAQGNDSMSVEEAQSLINQLPFTEAQIEIRYEIPESGESGAVVLGWFGNLLGKIKDVLDKIGGIIRDIGTVIDCMMYPRECRQAMQLYLDLLAGVGPPPIIEQPQPLSVGSKDSIWLEHDGRISLREVIEGMEALGSSHDNGFLIVRFNPNARVKMTSMNFLVDAPLSDSLKESYGLRGDLVVPRGDYRVEDGVLRIPVK